MIFRLSEDVFERGELSQTGHLWSARFAGKAVVVVVSLGLLMLGEAQMIIQLNVERRLGCNLCEHLPELAEVRLRLDVFGDCLSNRLKLFSIHNLPIVTH